MWTITVGQTTSFAVSGHDPDGSLQTLAYALASGAPTGAGIDSVSGMFTWSPTADQRGTNSFDGASNRQWHTAAERDCQLQNRRGNSQPVPTISPIADVNASVSQAIAFRVIGQDSDQPAQH